MEPSGGGGGALIRRGCDRGVGCSFRGLELPIPPCPQGEASSGILLYTLFTVDFGYKAAWCFAFSPCGRCVRGVVFRYFVFWVLRRVCHCCYWERLASRGRGVWNLYDVLHYIVCRAFAGGWLFNVFCSSCDALLQKRFAGQM